VRTAGLEPRTVLLDTALRFIIGAVFVVAGASKLPVHSEWFASLAAYKILPLSLVQPYMAALPWIEIVVGSCLIAGLFTRLFSIVVILLSASFILGNVLALSSNVAEGCACFGELVMVSHKWSLTIDALLIAAAVVIFFQRRRFLALDCLILPFSRAIS